MTKEQQDSYNNAQINAILEHSYDEEDDTGNRQEEANNLGGIDPANVNDVGFDDHSSRRPLKDPLKLLR